MSTSFNAEGTARSEFRVLVVDDNPDAADSLAMLVELWGYDVKVSYDGPSALETTRSYRPHVMLLDIGLPKMDGFQLAKHLRQQTDYSGPILIAMTGFSDKAHRNLWESAFHHYLVKPVPVPEVERLLASIKASDTRAGVETHSPGVENSSPQGPLFSSLLPA